MTIDFNAKSNTWDVTDYFGYGRQPKLETKKFTHFSDAFKAAFPEAGTDGKPSPNVIISK